MRKYIFFFQILGFWTALKSKIKPSPIDYGRVLNSLVFFLNSVPGHIYGGFRYLIEFFTEKGNQLNFVVIDVF